eukprot:2814613-Amphidinium_carterae.2
MKAESFGSFCSYKLCAPNANLHNATVQLQGCSNERSQLSVLLQVHHAQSKDGQSDSHNKQ